MPKIKYEVEGKAHKLKPIILDDTPAHRCTCGEVFWSAKNALKHRVKHMGIRQKEERARLRIPNK